VLPIGMAIAALSAVAVMIRRLLVLFAAPALLIRVERFEARTLVQAADRD
jgi:hypothetical protein